MESGRRRTLTASTQWATPKKSSNILFHCASESLDPTAGPNGVQSGDDENSEMQFGIVTEILESTSLDGGDRLDSQSDFVPTGGYVK